MTYLCDLCTVYGTDKGPAGWGYSRKYYEHLVNNRLRVEKVLEIGICGFRNIPNNVVGASLFVWRDFFPNAEIWGLDNDRQFIFNDQPRIHTLCCDAYDPKERELIMKAVGGDIDFILDDAIHYGFNQRDLFAGLLPYLKKGGTYVIEDAHPDEFTSIEPTIYIEGREFSLDVIKTKDENWTSFFMEEK